jgi:hypothetical protein
VCSLSGTRCRILSQQASDQPQSRATARPRRRTDALFGRWLFCACDVAAWASSHIKEMVSIVLRAKLFPLRDPVKHIFDRYFQFERWRFALSVVHNHERTLLLFSVVTPAGRGRANAMQASMSLQSRAPRSIESWWSRALCHAETRPGMRAPIWRPV